MSKDSLKKLNERNKALVVAKKLMEELSEEELLKMALKEEDFLPTPYDKRARKLVPFSPQKLWLEQNGFTAGKSRIHSRVVKYVLFKMGKTPEEIRYALHNLLPTAKDDRLFYTIKIDPFKPFIDEGGIRSFGSTITMSEKFWNVFKEEYAASKEKEKNSKV